MKKLTVPLTIVLILVVGYLVFTVRPADNQNGTTVQPPPPPPNTEIERFEGILRTMVGDFTGDIAYFLSTPQRAYNLNRVDPNLANKKVVVEGWRDGKFTIIVDKMYLDDRIERFEGELTVVSGDDDIFVHADGLIKRARSFYRLVTVDRTYILLDITPKSYFGWEHKRIIVEGWLASNVSISGWPLEDEDAIIIVDRFLAVI